MEVFNYGLILTTGIVPPGNGGCFSGQARSPGYGITVMISYGWFSKRYDLIRVDV